MMIKFLPQEIEDNFQNNLKDWCRGGPKVGGWTRRGLPIVLPSVRLIDYTWKYIPVEECLAKNRLETERWHLGFLNALLSLGKRKFYWKKTLYYLEYLKPRYDDEIGYTRAKSFIELFEDILDNGVCRAIMIADMGEFNMRFRYFRFDGCHRLCCAKIIGHKTVPALVFKVERCDSALRIIPNKYASQKNYCLQNHLL